jgi:hypothetical protein
MAQDLYGISSALAGVFKGSQFAITVGSVSSTLVGALVQSIALNYSREITRVWELGSLNQYYIQGHTQGQGQMQQIVGPQGVVSAMISALASICDASGNVLSLSAANEACSGNAGLTITLTAPLATNVSMGAQAQNMVVDSGMTFTFVSMSQS